MHTVYIGIFIILFYSLFFIGSVLCLVLCLQYNVASLFQTSSDHPIE